MIVIVQTNTKISKLSYYIKYEKMARCFMSNLER
jgi:hypothetical protein